MFSRSTQKQKCSLSLLCRGIIVFVAVTFVAGCSEHPTASQTTRALESDPCNLVSKTDIENLFGRETEKTSSKDPNSKSAICIFSEKDNPSSLVASVAVQASSLDFFLYQKSQKVRLGYAKELHNSNLDGFFATDTKRLSTLVDSTRVVVVKDSLSHSIENAQANSEKLAAIALKNLKVNTTPRTSTTTTSLFSSSSTTVDSKNEPVIADVQADVANVNNFWSAQFLNDPNFSGDTWVTVTDINPMPSFGGKKCGFSDAYPITENAVYCPLDNSVTYDEPWFKELANDNPQEDEIKTILAHELGHAVQFHGDISVSKSASLEQQADCFAGVYLATLKSKLNVSVVRNLFSSLGDPPNTSEADAHGSGPERRAAFERGFGGTVTDCLNAYK